MLAWLSVRGEVKICIWPSWCHCHSLSLNPVNPDWFLLFWYRLTQVVPDKWLLNKCVYVCVCLFMVISNCACVCPVADRKESAAGTMKQVPFLMLTAQMISTRAGND